MAGEEVSFSQFDYGGQTFLIALQSISFTSSKVLPVHSV